MNKRNVMLSPEEYSMTVVYNIIRMSGNNPFLLKKQVYYL